MCRIGYIADERAKKSDRGGEAAQSLTTAGSYYLSSLRVGGTEYCYQSLESSCATILWEQESQ